MGKSVNKSTFIGNLGDDPVVRYLPNGDAVCQFSLATSTEFKERESGKTTEYTEWHNIVAFKKKAEILGEYLMRGSKVYIDARHRTRKYNDANGVERFWSEFVVSDFTLLGNPRERAAESGSSQSANSVTGMPEGAREYLASPLPDVSFDDDIPY